MLEKACGAGRLRGCVILGNIYVNGNGVPVDKPGAVKSFESACAKRNLQACNNWGLLLREASDPSADAQAAELFLRACGSGELIGCRNLGVMHASYKIPGGSPEDGFVLFRKACRLGDERSCDALKAEK